MASNEEILRRRILERSVATDWEAAKDEWALERIEFCSLREPGECLCTHFPIVELCHLRNEKNGATAVVGNVCVAKFLGIPSAAIFRGFKRIMANPEKAPSRLVVAYAARHDWLSDEEAAFCMATERKRRLLCGDLATRMTINQRLAERVMAAQERALRALDTARLGAESDMGAR